VWLLSTEIASLTVTAASAGAMLNSSSWKKPICVLRSSWKKAIGVSLAAPHAMMVISPDLPPQGPWGFTCKASTLLSLWPISRISLRKEGSQEGSSATQPTAANLHLLKSSGPIQPSQSSSNSWKLKYSSRRSCE